MSIKVQTHLISVSFQGPWCITGGELQVVCQGSHSSILLEALALLRTAWAAGSLPRHGKKLTPFHAAMLQKNA